MSSSVNALYRYPSKKSGSVLQQIVGRRHYAFGRIMRITNVIDRLITYHASIEVSPDESDINYLTPCELERIRIIRDELTKLFKNRHNKYLLIKEEYDKTNRITDSNKKAI